MAMLARTIFEDPSEFEFFPAAPRPRPRRAPDTTLRAAPDRRAPPAARRGPPGGSDPSPFEAPRQQPAHHAPSAEPSSGDPRLAWIEQHATELSAEELLLWLLRSPGHLAARPAIVAASLRWLDQHAADPRAGQLITALLDLRNIELPAALIDNAIHFLAAEFRRDGDQGLPTVPGRLLTALLALPVLCVEQRQICRDFGVARLRSSIGSLRATYLFGDLCRASRTPGEWAELAELAIAWLEQRGAEESARFVFGPLLGGHGTGRQWWLSIARHAMAWVEGRAPGNPHVHVLYTFAHRLKWIDQELRERAVTAWLRWMDRGTSQAARELAARTRDSILPLASLTLHADQVARVLDGVAPAPPPRAAGPARTTELAPWLWFQARAVLPTPTDEIDRSLQRVTGLVHCNELHRTVAALPPLLALAARTGRSDLLDRAAELAGTVAGHPELPIKSRRRFVLACRSLLPVWPDRGAAEALVEALEDFL